MKKLKLTVAEPCHENWDSMTPDQKGRFCTACQKTVVDFTHMSDRQIADFFKKRAGSLCGRFHNDQLNREIAVPEKRISLPKYFFRYTWPVLLLIMKSCDEREESIAIMGVALEVTTPEMPPVVGNMLPEIIPLDSTESCTKSGMWVPPVVKGEIEIVPEKEMASTVTDVDKCQISEKADTALVAIDSTRIAVDSLKVVDYAANEEIIMGGIAIAHLPAQAEKKWQVQSQ